MYELYFNIKGVYGNFISVLQFFKCMTKAICCRLDPVLLEFIDSMNPSSSRSDKIRGVLLWLMQYKDSYLGSVTEYIESCITHNPADSSEKTCEEKILEA